MKADPERPEQIAEQIIDGYFIPGDREGLIAAVAAAIHAERAQTARLREKTQEQIASLRAYYGDPSSSWSQKERSIAFQLAQDLEAALREAAPEDRSHE